jgi:bacterioferritin-associated ferredoxin
VSIESWTQCSDCGFNLGQGHELWPPVTEQLPVGAECPRCGEPMQEVVPLSEVREALLGQKVAEAIMSVGIGPIKAQRIAERVLAAFPSTDSEGQG